MIVAADVPGSDVDDRDIAGNVFIALIAGEDTTANTLAWLLDFLHRHPEAMRRAREEVERVAPETASFTLEQMAELPFVDACINETMRLKPVAPLLPSQANQDTVVGDVPVPANTFVVGVMRPDALEERYFPDAKAFEPERWLVRHGRRAERASTTRVSMPFGAGPRLCPGRYLALLEMKMAIAMLLGALHDRSRRHARRRAGTRAVRFRDGAGRPGDEALAADLSHALPSRRRPGRPTARASAGALPGVSRRRPSQLPGD